MSAPLLLDTCAVLWISQDAKISPQATQTINEAYRSGASTFVSPATAWEIGILSAKGRIILAQSPQTFFDHVLANGCELADFSTRILINSSFLPGRPPNDPADRMIIATARELGLRLVTRDHRIIDYGKEGHVNVVAC